MCIVHFTFCHKKMNKCKNPANLAFQKKRENKRIVPHSQPWRWHRHWHWHWYWEPLGPNNRRTSIQILHPLNAPPSERIEDEDDLARSSVLWIGYVPDLTLVLHVFVFVFVSVFLLFLCSCSCSCSRSHSHLCLHSNLTMPAVSVFFFIIRSLS